MRCALRFASAARHGGGRLTTTRCLFAASLPAHVPAAAAAITTTRRASAAAGRPRHDGTHKGTVGKVHLTNMGGYGFIHADDGQEHFFMLSESVEKVPVPGDDVTFDAEMTHFRGEPRPRARNVVGGSGIDAVDTEAWKKMPKYERKLNRARHFGAIARAEGKDWAAALAARYEEAYYQGPLSQEERAALGMIGAVHVTNDKIRRVLAENTDAEFAEKTGMPLEEVRQGRNKTREHARRPPKKKRPAGDGGGGGGGGGRSARAGHRLFVSGLPNNMSRAQLREKFQPEGGHTLAFPRPRLRLRRVSNARGGGRSHRGHAGWRHRGGARGE